MADTFGLHRARKRATDAVGAARLEASLALWAATEGRILRELREAVSLLPPVDEPLVTVMMPTYCRAQVLTERTIPAVLAQTYANFELVIVGDHCTDDTVERMGHVKDERVRFFDLVEHGKYPTERLHQWRVAGSTPANAALALARGDYIAWVDDDDVVEPDHLHVLLTACREGNTELVTGCAEKEISPGEWVRWGEPDFPTGHRPFVSREKPHSAWLYRSYLRHFVYQSDSYRLGRATDDMFLQRIARAGVRTAHVDRVVVKAPLREGEAVRIPIGHIQTEADRVNAETGDADADADADADSEVFDAGGSS